MLEKGVQRVHRLKIGRPCKWHCVLSPPYLKPRCPPPRFSPLWKMHPQVSWADSATGICLSLYIIYEGVMSVWEAREQFVALLDGDEGLRLVRSSNLRARGEEARCGWGGVRGGSVPNATHGRTVLLLRSSSSLLLLLLQSTDSLRSCVCLETVTCV